MFIRNNQAFNDAASHTDFIGILPITSCNDGNAISVWDYRCFVNQVCRTQRKHVLIQPHVLLQNDVKVVVPFSTIGISVMDMVSIVTDRCSASGRRTPEFNQHDIICSLYACLFTYGMGHRGSTRREGK